MLRVLIAYRNNAVLSQYTQLGSKFRPIMGPRKFSTHLSINFARSFSGNFDWTDTNHTMTILYSILFSAAIQVSAGAIYRLRSSASIGMQDCVHRASSCVAGVSNGFSIRLFAEHPFLPLRS